MVVQELITLLGFKTDEAGLRAAEMKAQAVVNRVGAIGSTMSRTLTRSIVGIGAGLASIPFISTVLEPMTREAEQAAIALALLEKRIETTGGAIGYTAKELQSFAGSIAESTLFDDDQIIGQVTNRLLMFGKIGAGVFNRAQQAIVDLAAESGDLQGAAIALGKSLNEPGEQLRILKNYGIDFTDAEVDMLKALAETNQHARAQSYILDRLEKSIGGNAKRVAEASGGAAMLRKELAEMSEVIGQELMPYLKALSLAIGGAARWFRALDDTTRKWIIGIAMALAITGPLMMAFKAISSALIAMRAAWIAVGIAGMVANIKMFALPLLIAGAIALLVVGINELWTAINGGDSIIGRVFGMFKNLVSGALTTAFKTLDDIIDNVYLNLAKIGPMLEYVFTGKFAKGIKFSDFMGDFETRFIQDQQSRGNMLPTPSASMAAISDRIASGGSLAQQYQLPVSSVGKSVKVDATINMQVPQGTPPEQIMAVDKAARRAAEEVFNDKIFQTYRANPRVE